MAKRRRSSSGNNPDEEQQRLISSPPSEADALLGEVEVEDVIDAKICGCNAGLANVLFLSFGFLFVFSAFQTTQGYAVPLLGDFASISLALLYSIFSFANFISPLIVRKLGDRLSLMLGALSYSIYIFSLVYVLDYVVLIASIIIGVGAGVIWTAQGNVLVSTSTSKTIAKNSGYFWSVFMFGFGTGNTVASTILLLDNSTSTQPARNSSEWPSGWQGSDSVLFLALGCMSLIGLIFFFLIRRKGMKRGGGSGAGKEVASAQPSLRHQLASIFKLLCDKRTVCIIPYMLYIGWATTFYAAQFTRQIPSKVNVGFTMATFGLAEIIGSNVGGIVSKKKGPQYAVFSAMVCQTVALTTTYFADKLQGNLVDPSFADTYLFVIAAVFLGLADSLFNTQSYILIQNYYAKDEVLNMAAMQKFLQSIATTAGFFVNPFLVDHNTGRSTPSQLAIELAICGGLLALNLVGYISLLITAKKHVDTPRQSEEHEEDR
mmetsp:Transcript_33676/g.86340  ORF Transcript_33676/g.86340 Transcript_33676/m.86340 type:complete len:489 (-) Transcript_33676:539-2005(-)